MTRILIDKVQVDTVAYELRGADAYAFWGRETEALTQADIEQILTLDMHYKDVQRYLRQIHGLPPRLAEKMEKPECLIPPPPKKEAKRAYPKKS